MEDTRIAALELDMRALREAVQKHAKFLQGDEDLGVDSLPHRMRQIERALDDLSDTQSKAIYFLAANAGILVVMGIVLLVLLLSN